MYQVTIINGAEETIIHYPTSDNAAPHLLKMDLVEKLGETTQFNFTIPFFNDGYSKIVDLVTLVRITTESETVFEGRVLISTQEMSSNGEFYKDVIAESEIAYLNDTRTRAWDIKNMSVGDFITKVIDNHNSHTTTDKQFTKGNIEVTGSITCTTAFENSLNVLIDKMVNTLGVGYLVIRKENGIRYLDYLPQLSGTSADIVLGKNMKDISFTKDVTNIATRVIPVGKDNLTIESVNNGKDYLENTNAAFEFGIIEQVLEFKDISDANTLKSKGQAKLTDVSKATYKLSTNVLDLYTLDLDPHSFYVGTDTRIKNPVINFDESFTIIQKNTNLLSPQNSTITVNDKFETMTDRQVSLQRVAQYVDKILTADKQLNTFYLDGYINLLKNQMGAMADTAEKQQAKAILFEDKVPNSPSYGAMALGTQGFMIADTIVNGEWDFRTFGTGKGFTADLIVAGIILGGALEINLNEGYLKMLHTDGTWSVFNADSFTRGGNPYKFMRYQVIRPAIQNGTTETIVLPEEFQGKAINTDFSVYAWAGAIDSDAFSTFKVDAIRNVFIQVVSWDSSTRELKIKPCLQKIGLDTHTYFGWDANTTTEGNPIGEGKIDIYVFVDM